MGLKPHGQRGGRRIFKEGRGGREGRGRDRIFLNAKSRKGKFSDCKEKCSQSCPFATPWTVASVHGILQERILEWVAISFSGGSS